MYKMISGLLLALGLIACGQAPTYKPSLPASAVSEGEKAGSFSEDDISSMVSQAESSATVPQPSTAEASQDQDALATPEVPPSSFAEAMSVEVDHAFAGMVEDPSDDQAAEAQQKKKPKASKIKNMVKNLVFAANKGDKKKVLKIASALLKEVDNSSNQQKDEIKSLVKKIIKAANKNKKEDLKKALKDLSKLLKK